MGIQGQGFQIDFERMNTEQSLSFFFHINFHCTVHCCKKISKPCRGRNAGNGGGEKSLVRTSVSSISPRPLITLPMALIWPTIFVLVQVESRMMMMCLKIETFLFGGFLIISKLIVLSPNHNFVLVLLCKCESRKYDKVELCLTKCASFTNVFRVI